MLKFFKKRQILLRTNALELIPVRLQSFDTDSKGIVTIKIPKISNEKLANRIIPKSRSKYSTLELDEIGSAVWQEINGEQKTEQICSRMADRFGDKIHPVQERVVKFLSGLYNNKCLTFKQLQ